MHLVQTELSDSPNLNKDLFKWQYPISRPVKRFHCFLFNPNHSLVLFCKDVWVKHFTCWWQHYSISSFPFFWLFHIPAFPVQHTAVTSSEITLTWLTLLQVYTKVERCSACCGHCVWTNWLLLSLNATIHSLWDISPGNLVSGGGLPLL
jgi:hypothetical protein